MLAKLGPGLLFAAAAVGTSHLVQSTRAGAGFGLTFVLIIAAICFLKYPVFRFGAEYAAATGQSLIQGYAERGRWAVALLALAVIIEGTGAIAGVALVTQGVGQLVLGAGAPDAPATIAIILLTAVIVAGVHYQAVERLTRAFVVVFSVLVLLGTIIVLPNLFSGGALAKPFALTQSNAQFAVAVSGWMPIGNVAALMLAAWVLAKGRTEGRQIQPPEARWDFNVGYVATAILALAFVLLGTATLFGREVEMPYASVGFASFLMNMFTQAFGGWAFWLMAVISLVVMYSTLLAIVDGFPRLLTELGSALQILPEDQNNRHRLFATAIMVVLPTLLIWLFLDAFTGFMDLVTTISFLVAPFIAWGNHVLITKLPPDFGVSPSVGLRIWSGAAIAVMSGASLAYLANRFLT